MRKFWSITIVILLAVVSCKEPDPLSGLRVKNNSQYDFSSVSIKSPGGDVEYSALTSGAYSAYKEVDYTHSYAYVKVIIDGNEFIIQPIDYVGEPKYENCLCTFELDVTDYANRVLSLEFKQD